MKGDGVDTGHGVVKEEAGVHSVDAGAMVPRQPLNYLIGMLDVTTSES